VSDSRVDEHGRTWLRCVDCAEPFFVSAAARRTFLDRGLVLPTRCYGCRDRRRLVKEIREHEEGR
jgi:hypothetical protein